MLEARTAIVLGAGPAMGRATALARAEECVVLAARSRKQLASVAGEIEAKGGAALAIATDMTDAGGCCRLVEQAAKRFGRVDGQFGPSVCR